MTRDENISSFEKLEFWALTAVFILCLPIFMDGDLGATIRYVIVFLSILYVDFRVVPALIQREHVLRNALALAVTIVFIMGTFFITSSLTFREFDFARSSFFVLIAIAAHLLIKNIALFIVSKAKTLQSFFMIVNRDGLIAFGLWMIITYWLLIIGVPTEVKLAWMAVIPTGILLHGIAFHYFLPSSLRWRYPLLSYFFKVGIFCVVMSMVVSVLTMVATENEDRAFMIGSFTGIVNMIFTAPVLFLIYRWRMKGREEINALQNELGRSAANLDFLRSQINPHFLFNALNTIYGLAIHEKAERTSASVEKLGDMMRFMLLENMQEKITLKRELEYLDNYISLQKLRTDTNTQLTISVDIPGDIDPAVTIMPMLLIPFVENAFKHGISLREQSYIRISLEVKGFSLYFDVVNSAHSKLDNDPERDSNGIGLENVRQRLQHMYAGRHELLTRQTSHDFFVHLRIDLE